MRLSLLLILVVLSAEANVSSVRFKHELTSKTNTGTKQKWKFERTAKNFLLNGQKISADQMARHPDAIRTIQLKPVVKTEHCSAGSYQFVSTRPGLRKVVEKGCLGSERFARLRSAFEVLAGRKF